MRVFVLGGISIGSKQYEYQRFVFKIHSDRLRKNKWNLSLSLADARKNDEVITLASSQVLRWIDEINGVSDADDKARAIKMEIKRIKSEPHSAENLKNIRKLYSDLDKLQFKKDYMCLIIDRNSDYMRACKGFTINGVKYTRLLGTPGGIKMSTIVFISEAVSGEVRRRIDNGRDQSKQFVPAKLEAYRALTCSASTPVSMPSGVLVVNDVETTFRDMVVNLSNSDTGEPVMSEPHYEDVTITASDGCGMMLPSLAEKWSADMRLNYLIGGCCIRMAWTKGMVYTFPFDEFAESVAGRYIVKDAWGDDVDIRGVELVLPVSMVKLWDSYSSCDEWLSKSTSNHYTFAVTKVCVEHLESERTLNYQFEQIFDMTADDIDELVEPTISEIKDALGGDWAKTVLYLKGCGLNERNVLKLDDDWQKALMIEPKLIDDPFVRSNIFNLIRKRIEDAKVGVLKVHGNYSTASGDLYALCQSMFGLPVTGLLSAGEIYNYYWAESSADELLAFRAPMSCAENVRRVSPSRNDEVRKWFRYMRACTVISCWSNEMSAMNGMDFDGDLVMLTDNPVLLRRQVPLPTLMCAQKKGAKCIPTEADIIQSNISSFGNEVGAITNRTTSMYEILSRFEGTDEIDTLMYRIRCGQLYQQDCIDKAKGIISAPMPRSWYDRHSINTEWTHDKQRLYKSVVADRKPYFMRYIYPALNRQYTTYQKAANKNALREFELSLDEILSMPVAEMTESQFEFIQRYKRYLPVGIGDCTMNRICRKIEAEFDGLLKRCKQDHMFDSSILKSGVDYSASHCSAIKRLMYEYNQALKDQSVCSGYERIDQDEKRAFTDMLDEQFLEKCAKVCPDNEELCEIVVDLCYSKENTKQFAWKMCGDTIVKNLMVKNKTISFPTKKEEGDIIWKSERFAVASVVLDVVE